MQYGPKNYGITIITLQANAWPIPRLRVNAHRWVGVLVTLIKGDVMGESDPTASRPPEPVVDMDTKSDAG